MTKNSESKKNNSEIERQKLTDQRLRRLPGFIKLTRWFDPRYVTIDLLTPYGYLCIKPGVDCAYSLTIESLDPEQEAVGLSASEHRRLIDFLEACAQFRAVTYRRDGNGFCWCVDDKDAYCVCCEEFGYTDDDFEVHRCSES